MTLGYDLLPVRCLRECLEEKERYPSQRHIVSIRLKISRSLKHRGSGTKCKLLKIEDKMQHRLCLDSNQITILSQTGRFLTKTILSNHQPNMDDTAATLQLLLRFGSLGCIGYTNNDTYCNNPISKANLREANSILDAITSGVDTAYIYRKIPELAALCLCKRRHQDQADDLVQIWDLEDVARPSRPRDVPCRIQARVSVDIDQVFTEMHEMDVMLDNHDREMREMAQRFRQTMSLYEQAQSVTRKDAAY